MNRNKKERDCYKVFKKQIKYKKEVEKFYSLKEDQNRHNHNNQIKGKTKSNTNKTTNLYESQNNKIILIIIIEN